MANLTNGTLDTRLAQNLVKEFNIPANKEYDKLNPFKIGGGNAIWITHIPPNIKVWFSTDQNFDNAQRLDYMNRGMRYLKIGEQGITRLYDNFFIFTEGVVDDDYIKVCVSTQGEDVEPILSSNTNQIDQVDAVGKIGTLNLINDLGNPAYEKLKNITQEFNFKNKIIGVKQGGYGQNGQWIEDNTSYYNNNAVNNNLVSPYLRYAEILFDNGKKLYELDIGSVVIFDISFVGAIDVSTTSKIYCANNYYLNVLNQWNLFFTCFYVKANETIDIKTRVFIKILKYDDQNSKTNAYYNNYVVKILPTPSPTSEQYLTMRIEGGILNA